MNIELKPCPFCGGEAEMMGDQYPYVECQECGAGFTANHSYEFDEGDAASKWNARSAAGDSARAQGGQGVEAVAWGPKPSKPGRYVVRGFDSAGTEALVCVAEDDGELTCNLHDSNSNPLESYSNLMSEISDRFEWVELHTQPAQQGVPDGWISMADRHPTKSDEDCEGKIWLLWPDRRYFERVLRGHVSCSPEFCWMPTGLKRPQPPQEGE